MRGARPVQEALSVDEKSSGRVENASTRQAIGSKATRYNGAIIGSWHGALQYKVGYLEAVERR